MAGLTGGSYHEIMVLPTTLEKELERFKEAYGPGWYKRLREILREEAKRKKAALEAAELARRISATSGLTEEEVFRTLEKS